ncbi:mediator complex subunit Med31 [Schizosaccharomyces cryophilus OY26]|uniref:Mediator of RNA polymerase II transcription subunit 31 n=1 Tax=Schizosaccharomyces cryophilus (strain OY26 / ATCC MYA-4695 / CBS 11777 / NBRC 106824 / NRRL Y48691) TaxID=653667 RepID=S9VV39_SCHCR|nr:mediator complex subunit Med31 [Schizosaccharomyces cryophilus OY26]EPY49935.1 mediator complex subunit Med31 [Schizosaccharomyces cryophilus OY26]
MEPKWLLSRVPDEKSRFEIELEFVQMLSNPWYLNFLAQHKYFEDETFLQYLEYLEYWREPDYVKFIIYPTCLHMLTLLKNPQFRIDISRADLSKQVNDEMYYEWLAKGGYQIPNPNPDSLTATGTKVEDP